jgi:hypothetical protein
VAGVFDTEKITLFVNGKAAATTPVPRDRSGGYRADVRLGWNLEETQRFEGLLDELSFWRRALGEDEIRSSYEQRMTPACKP